MVMLTFLGVTALVYGLWLALGYIDAAKFSAYIKGEHPAEAKKAPGDLKSASLYVLSWGPLGMLGLVFFPEFRRHGFDWFWFIR